MKTIILFLSLILVLSWGQFPEYSAPGRYGYAYRDADIPGTTETMRGSRIFYPDSAGQFPASAVPAPIVAFGHGWMIGISSYFSYARHLASWGYVVVLPTYSNPLLWPEHDKRARLMIDAARWVANRDTIVGDPFYHKLDRWNWGFVGHSMGGSISMLAADTFRLPDTLRAVAALASPQSDPVTHPAHLLTPKMILAGGSDNIAPWRDVRQAFWNGAPPPGTFAVISRASHTDFLDGSFGNILGIAGTLGRDTTQLAVRRHLTAFFERYLRGDRSPWNYAYVFGDSIIHSRLMDSVEVQPEMVPTEEPVQGDNMRIGTLPTVVRDLLVIPYPSGAAHDGQYLLLDVSGRQVQKLYPGCNHLGRLRPGVYFVRRTHAGSSPNFKIIVVP